MLKRIFLTFLAIIFAIISFAVVAVQYQRQPEVLVVTDDIGHELQFFELPKRLVVLEPGVGYLLEQWRRQHLAVATSDELVALFPRAENLGTASDITVLQIAATRPDLVIAGARDRELAKKLRQSGFPVLMVAPNRLERLLAWPETLGTLVSASRYAKQSAQQLEKQLAEYKQASAESPGAGQRVLWFADEQFTAAGANTLEADLIELVSAANAIGGKNGYTTVELKDILATTATVIIAPETIMPTIESQLPQPVSLDGEVPERPSLVLLPVGEKPISWDNIFTYADWLQDNLLPSEPVAE